MLTWPSFEGLPRGQSLPLTELSIKPTPQPHPLSGAHTPGCCVSHWSLQDQVPYNQGPQPLWPRACWSYSSQPMLSLPTQFCLFLLTESTLRCLPMVPLSPLPVTGPSVSPKWPCVAHCFSPGSCEYDKTVTLFPVAFMIHVWPHSR